MRYAKLIDGSMNLQPSAQRDRAENMNEVSGVKAMATPEFWGQNCLAGLVCSLRVMRGAGIWRGYQNCLLPRKRHGSSKGVRLGGK
jgi:hypothetical protein